VSAPRGEEYYYRRSEQIQNEHPDWTTDQITNKMSEEIWNNNYNALMDDIAHSKTPEERDQKIKDYQAELDNYKASGINVDNDVEYLRDVQGMPKETISSKIVSLMSKYSFNGVEYQYSVPPDSFAFVEIPKDGISIEKYTDYQIQKNDDENTLHNSFQQQVEELFEKAKKLQFTNGRQLTDADREAGYQPMPTLNGLTYVRAIYEDGNWVIHPDDRQLAQESNQDVAKGMLLGGVLLGVIKGVGVGGKSLLKAFTQESSKVELDYITTSGLKLEVTPGKTTTVLGTYMDDTKNILGELGNVKSTDFGPRDGGFNLLNTPDKLYKTSQQFWNEYNKPWLDNVIARNDIIKLATEPTNDVLYRINIETGIKELSGFGKEYDYLLNHGYKFDSNTMQMIPKN